MDGYKIYNFWWAKYYLNSVKVECFLFLTDFIKINNFYEQTQHMGWKMDISNLEDFCLLAYENTFTGCVSGFIRRQYFNIKHYI